MLHGHIFQKFYILGSLPCNWLSVTLFPERKVLCPMSSRRCWTQVLNPGGTGLPRGASRRFQYIVAPVWSCHQTLMIFVHSLSLVASVLGCQDVSRHDSRAKKTDSDAFFSAVGLQNSHPMHVRKLTVDMVDAKFQPSKPYTV